MSKITKKILGASLSLAAFSFGYISTASAQTCTQPMTCEEMGYIDTVDRCEGDAMIKCPSDLSKVFCRNRKACTPNACSDYTLSSCPANGNCSTCDKVNDDCSSGGTKYKLDSCKTTPNACSGYTLSSCPANGNCSTCDKVNDDCSNGGTKYKLDSCESGYKVSGNECVPDKKTYQCSFDGYSYWITNGPYWIAENGQIGVDAECECNCVEFPVFVRLDRITSPYVYDSFEQGMNSPGEETQRNSEVGYNCGLMCDRTVTEDDSGNFVN